MHKKYRLWLVLDVMLLVILYMGSFTDSFFQKQEQEIWNVSVIIDMAEDGTEKNFQHGLEKAARKYKMDMRYVNIRKYKSNTEQLAETLKKEITRSCDALILGCSEKYAEQVLETLPMGVPVVLIDTPIDFPMAEIWLQEDEEGIARKMTDLLLQNERDKKMVLLVPHPQSSEQVHRIHEMVAWKLQNAGMACEKIEMDSAEDWDRFINQMWIYKDCAVVTADTVALETIARECEVNSKKIPLYGMGWSSAIRKGMEDNVISGIIVPHTFEAGYTAMYAVNKIMSRYGIQNAKVEIPTVVVTKENLYNDKMVESVLFPFL